jgi:hypothetical protein
MKTLSLDFPQPLTEKYRPERIADFVGITEAKATAQAIISRPIPNTAYLFCGERLGRISPGFPLPADPRPFIKEEA